MPYGLVPPLIYRSPIEVRLLVKKDRLDLILYGGDIEQQFIYNRREEEIKELSIFSNCTHGLFLLTKIQEENDITYSELSIHTDCKSLKETLMTTSLVVNTPGRIAKKTGLHTVKMLDKVDYNKLAFFK